MQAIEPLSLPHRLWRLLPTKARRRLFAEVSARLAPRPDRAPPSPTEGLIVAGELSLASGLGEGARLMQAALDELGVPSCSLDVSGILAPTRRSPSLVHTASRPQRALPPGWGVVLHVNPPMVSWVLARQKRGVIAGRRIIGYWSWDLETVPATWWPAARLVHEVWAPSRFAARAIERLLPGRVRVVPHPVAISPPTPGPLDRAAFGLPEKAVITLVSFNLASSFARKNPLAAIAAFRIAFAGRTDRLLVIKVGNAANERADFAKIREAAADLSNVRIITETLPPADNYALMMASDVVLSLHRSEGFGLVPAEAMLLGKPVVATGWSGNLDFMDQDCSALVPYRLIPACDPRGVFEARGAFWAEADIGVAAARLIALANDTESRRVLGARAKIAARRRLGVAPLRAALLALRHGESHDRKAQA